MVTFEEKLLAHAISQVLGKPVVIVDIEEDYYTQNVDAGHYDIEWYENFKLPTDIKELAKWLEENRDKLKGCSYVKIDLLGGTIYCYRKRKLS